ncbi:MAG: lipoprotein [Pseudomonadota bacterium]
MKAHTPYLMTVLCLMTCLGGCGFKGDLYLPNESNAPASLQAQSARHADTDALHGSHKARSVDEALRQGVQDTPNVSTP